MNSDRNFLHCMTLQKQVVLIGEISIQHKLLSSAITNRSSGGYYLIIKTLQERKYKLYFEWVNVHNTRARVTKYIVLMVEF